MRKKTFKIFMNSFLISLFTIWAMNGLLAIPEQNNDRNISIPDKNIALFFQQDAPMVNFASSTPVSSFSLAAPKTKPAEKDFMIDEGLFVFDDPKEDGVKISAIEDVADIPLETISETSDFVQKESENTQPLAYAEPTVAKLSASAPDQNKSFQKTDLATLVAPVSQKDENVNRSDESLIPIEFENNSKSEKVEIATQAPANQIAMAEGGKVDLDSISVEQKAEKAKDTSPEWYEMSEIYQDNDNPWVVAKGTRNPKNNYVLEEDFYKGMSESEISAALNAPKTMADESKEVQVAEMVKNILIPIPEDILNDKNLTPQLVSPKKNKKNTEKAPEVSPNESESKKEGGILKSLTSIFSGTEEDTSDSNDDLKTEEEESPKKRRGLFSAFGGGKSSTKILPAEMRLSFQPGRAEISGTTLRWIQAFANKVIEDPSVILEIRIDRTSSFELQQKRLNLLHNILTNKGVDYGRINTVFTSREPNSFIIRTLRINDNVNNTAQENKRGQTLYYQSW